MEREQIFQRNAEFFAFFLSGICAISSGVVVSILQGIYGSTYGMTRTLLSLVSIGNLLAGFASGMPPAGIGTKKTMVFLAASYGTGYMTMGFSGWILVLILGSFMVGVAKGSAINTCTILVAGNSDDRTKSVNIMYGRYALDALLYPFLIIAAIKAENTVPMLVLAACGLLLRLTFCVTPAETKAMEKDWNIDEGFFKNRKFWVLTDLLFYQNTVETSVTGWIVTYFKGNGIISRSLSPYIITVIWGATLTARLLIAFTIPIKNSYSVVIRIGIGCVIFYTGLMMVSTQTAAIPLLFAFAFTMAGMSSTVTTSAGHVASAVSMGVMLPVAGSGTVIMPWIIGIVSKCAGIEIGMASSITPCAGMLLFSAAVKRLKE